MNTASAPFVVPNDPISRIVWKHVSSLKMNAYNPNIVQEPELKLLEYSIIKSGWTQAILIASESGLIIDGFHRYMLSKESSALKKKYQGYVPCVLMNITEVDAMMLTVRMNRAKGTHAAVRMSALVKSLVDNFHVSRDEICVQTGADLAEVELLYQDSIFHSRGLKNYRYSAAWVPGESGARGATFNKGYHNAGTAVTGKRSVMKEDKPRHEG